MISFDVKSLFTNVRLDEALSTILRKIHDEGKIKKKYSKKRNGRIVTPTHKTRTLHIQWRYLYSVR